MTHGPWPRQPRSGCASNLARKVTRGVGGEFWYEVECRRCDGTWLSVASFSLPNGSEADLMVNNLNNNIFSRPGADLDFIHIYRYGNDDYAAVWSGVEWCNDHSCSTRLCDSSKRTFENLYKSNGVTSIKRVQGSDVTWYGIDAWRVAYTWVRNIKQAINGWNATKGAENIPLFGDGKIIPRLARRTGALGPRRRKAVSMVTASVNPTSR